MKSRLQSLPSLLTAFVIAAMWWHGPIAQLAHYHEFADQSSWLGISHAADVVSNLGFALVALFGMFHLYSARSAHNDGTSGKNSAGYLAYCLFAVSLLLTTFCSGYYHLAPDDARLFWDRLPIALACAGLLAAVRAETRNATLNAKLNAKQGGASGGTEALRDLVLLAGVAVFSVCWWQQTGDLRPYLLLQALTLLLIPLWQTIYQAAGKDRIAFGVAILLYVAAKIAELEDATVLMHLKWISGHSLKHLLATAAAAVIVVRLVLRGRERQAA